MPKLKELRSGRQFYVSQMGASAPRGHRALPVEGTFTLSASAIKEGWAKSDAKAFRHAKVAAALGIDLKAAREVLALLPSGLLPAGEELSFESVVKLCYHMTLIFDVAVHPSMDDLFETTIQLSHLVRGQPGNFLSDYVNEIARARPRDCYLSLLPADVLEQVATLPCHVPRFVRTPGPLRQTWAIAPLKTPSPLFWAVCPLQQYWEVQPLGNLLVCVDANVQKRRQLGLDLRREGHFVSQASLVALYPETGEIKWRSEPLAMSYGTPIVVTQERDLVAFDRTRGKLFKFSPPRLHPKLIGHFPGCRSLTVYDNNLIAFRGDLPPYSIILLCRPPAGTTVGPESWVETVLVTMPANYYVSGSIIALTTFPTSHGVALLVSPDHPLTSFICHFDRHWQPIRPPVAISQIEIPKTRTVFNDCEVFKVQGSILFALQPSAEIFTFDLMSDLKQHTLKHSIPTNGISHGASIHTRGSEVIGLAVDENSVGILRLDSAGAILSSRTLNLPCTSPLRQSWQGLVADIALVVTQDSNGATRINLIDLVDGRLGHTIFLPLGANTMFKPRDLAAPSVVVHGDNLLLVRYDSLACLALK